MTKLELRQEQHKNNLRLKSAENKNSEAEVISHFYLVLKKKLKKKICRITTALRLFEYHKIKAKTRRNRKEIEKFGWLARLS